MVWRGLGPRVSAMEFRGMFEDLGKCPVPGLRMDAVGLPDREQDGFDAQDEAAVADKRIRKHKCVRGGRTSYLDVLPAEGSAADRCWERVWVSFVRGHGGYPLIPVNAWVNRWWRLNWQPKSLRWSEYSEEEYRMMLLHAAGQSGFERSDAETRAELLQACDGRFRAAAAAYYLEKLNR